MGSVCEAESTMEGAEVQEMQRQSHPSNRRDHTTKVSTLPSTVRAFTVKATMSRAKDAPSRGAIVQVSSWLVSAASASTATRPRRWSMATT